MIRIEIELQGENVQDNIFDLRNYLKEQMPDNDFFIKTQPAGYGQMGGLDDLIGGILHASTAIVLEEIYHNLIKPLLNAWLKKRNSEGVQLEVMSSLTGNEEKVHFVEDVSGNTQVYNLKYAIDTDKTFALLIGAGKFTSSFKDIPPVKGNLEDFYKILTDKKHIGIPRDQVVISYNEPHVEIQKQLLQASRMPDLQTLIIYFAGHGHRTDVKKLTLIATDSEKIDDDIIGGIDFDFISNKVLKKAVASQKILILDTCHSGIAAQGDDDVAMNFDVKGSYILTSSPGDEVSYFEKNAKHTYFTGALLDVLENGIDNTNDMLALEDLFAYTKEVLSEKDFPHPNSKSELNIPPANFFIARNPSFSAEKLKWRAGNLLRDGKMEEAMDEYRMLLKRFPQDENLRKQFEECETALRFSKLREEADTLFYQAKNYQQAAVIYKRAYGVKKDAMVMEKIRQCEQQFPPSAGADPLATIKANPDFIAFKKAAGRNAFYTAFQHLKKVKQAFPRSEYINDEIIAAETIMNRIADSRNDERLNLYFQLLKKGGLEKATTELETQISNDPEYPEFIKLQQALVRRIKEKKEEDNEKENSLVFRLFQTFSKNVKLVAIVGIAALVIIIFLVARNNKDNHSLVQLRAMLVVAPDKAIEILKEKAVKDDSARLVLGDYYMGSSNNTEAYSAYSASKLPAAKTAIGIMFYRAKPNNKANDDSAKKYFDEALKLGTDTSANYFLGMMALEKYYHPLPTDNSSPEEDWNEAVDNLKEGIKNNCTRCKDSLSSTYFRRGYQAYRDYKNDEANSYLSLAAIYENTRAMLTLGDLYADSLWEKSNIFQAEKWYKKAAKDVYGPAPMSLAALFIEHYSGAYYDTAYNLLTGSYKSPFAYFYLGRIFENGGGSVPKRSDSAVFYYRKAALSENKFFREKAEARLKKLSSAATGNSDYFKH
ncbi:MAG: caspase family protein [Ferruginibacter sp.]